MQWDFPSAVTYTSRLIHRESTGRWLVRLRRWNELCARNGNSKADCFSDAYLDMSRQVSFVKHLTLSTHSARFDFITCLCLANLEPILVNDAGLAWRGSMATCEGLVAHAFFHSTLKRQAKRPSSCFSFLVGGAEASAIGSPLKTCKMHHCSVTTTDLHTLKNRQPLRAEKRSEKKKSLKREPLFSEELGTSSGLHELTCAARTRASPLF